MTTAIVQLVLGWCVVALAAATPGAVVAAVVIAKTLREPARLSAEPQEQP